MLQSFYLILMLTAVSSLAAASLDNGDFSKIDDDGLPAGWEVDADGYEVSVDDEQPAREPHSLRIKGPDGVHGAMIEQSFAAGDVRASRHRLTGKIRTEGIVTSASLVVIVSDEDGATLFSDDMADRVVSGDTDWSSHQIDVPALSDAESVTIAVLVIGSGTAWFDALDFEALSEENGESSEEWLEYVDKAVDTLQDRYVAADRVDWDNLRAFARKSAAQATTQADAHSVVSAVVARLDDSHASFVRSKSEMPEDAESDPDTPAKRSARVSEHRERLRLITVPGIEGDPLSTTATDYVDGAWDAIETADSEMVCGWIVDLRESDGGTMWPLLAALGPILGAGDVGFFRARDPHETATWFYRDAEAGMRIDSEKVVRANASRNAPQLHSPTPPVAVVVSEDTASAGEAVAVAFIGRENTRLFGQPTFGHASANGNVPMPDGALLVFPIAHAADRDGNLHYPHISPEVTAEPDQVMNEAEQWLFAQPGCEG